MVTKAEFLFMIQSVNLPPSAHTITSSAHTAAAITYSVHTAANLQCTLQPTAAIYNHLHCSYTIQCTSSAHTLQPIFSAHCSYTIQCTLQLHYLVPIPYSASSAPLNHHRVSLYHYWPTSRAVSRH